MTRRPIGVWLIVAYYAWSSASALIGVGYAFLSQDPDLQWGRDYYLALNVWQIAFVIGGALLAISAAVALFLMRRIAAPLFTIVLVAGIVNSVWQASSGWVANKGVEMLGKSGVWLSLSFGLALMVTIVSYVWWLRAKGRLS